MILITFKYDEDDKAEETNHNNSLAEAFAALKSRDIDTFYIGDNTAFIEITIDAENNFIVNSHDYY